MSKKTHRKTDKGVYFLSIAAVVLLVGVASYVVVSKLTGKHTMSQSDKKSKDAYASISKDDIQFIGTEGDTAWNANDPYFGYNKLPVVALVHIDSIDGGRNYSPIFDQYVYTQTVGKMTVLDVYKGDVKAGQQLNYSRLGGIITFNDYWNGLNQAQKDKRLHLNNGEKNPTGEKFVKQKFSDDIDIEADKNYVVFLLPQTSKDDTRQEYFIDGMQYGLREARGSGTDMTVLNNDTKQWESLSKIVKLS